MILGIPVSSDRGGCQTIHSYIVSVAAILLAVVHLAGVLWQEKQTHQEMLNSELGNLPQQPVIGNG